ncbi:dynein regulatory complex subunit 7 isoform X2 [Cynoglossus semilaevis]|nr:dynein regulatory complex subunit 7-like isoform X2 [Cynoglossus semilaevis]XP_016891368.1 dynein regulatory complex subunit 7-like isoform X2 [Cynoglossus semilaevis]XP_016891370.1 dynein regulatory complex subunit 7-like isoform X2 [Cynoglossus semilaevis]XP_024915421.1 dynein regulatory complex subunit 7-like isoform X2 [Cynoglossus semilaevis]XP_024915422.1 dynein regulatory complex subunit 7-like isoform X2 [Cynoglossus semilaevis]XP_024915423.1 dynein regulatory complex subunit 7-like
MGETSYNSNSTHELQLLAMVDNFSRQYSHLYPERKPLMLCPVNECGVKKFVSTTLRPAPTNHPELHMWEGCAAFVADFINLEPLDPPHILPPRLRSPSFVLKTQKASCFEYPTVLCCLLLGSDYDAYCVSGYAVRQMCLLDQSLKDCPLVYTKLQSLQIEEEAPQSKYTVKPPRQQESQFVEQQEKTTEEEEEQKEAEEEMGEEELLHYNQQAEERGTQEPEDLLRIHCWVLVLAGYRGVKQNFFIDPLTGMSYRTNSPSFLGIESVWNNYNCYINMQDCGQGCSDMVYDLEDINLWEPVVHGAISKVQLMSSTEKDDDSPYYNYMEEEEIEAEVEEEENEPLPFIMPKSWISIITILKSDLETRFPRGHKVVNYRKSKLQRYAQFLRTDGLVTRLIKYSDTKCTDVTTVIEQYMNRRDHLEQRTIDKVDGFTTDVFKHGRRFHLKLHRYQALAVHGIHEMEFSESARVDDMLKRVVSPGEMTETFQNRSDFLCYRHTVFSRNVQFSENKNAEPNIYLQKVVERFNRNRSKLANEDVAERVFNTSEGCVEVTFHLQRNRIIPSKMVYVKSAGQRKVVEPQRPRSPSKQEIASLIADEEQLFIRIKESMKEVKKMVLSRAEEEKDIHLFFSPWVTTGAARARKQREEMEHHAAEELRWLQRKEEDTLAPVLFRLNNPKALGAKEAKRLRQECISSYKQRLSEKETQILERLEKEKKELQQKQDWYQKNQLTVSAQEEEEYHKFCSDKTLKIHVVQTRLNMHREEAPQRLQDFDKRVREDNRLSRLLLK